MSNEIGAVFSLKDEFSGKIDGIKGKVEQTQGAFEGVKGAAGKVGGALKTAAKGFAVVSAAGAATFAAVNKVVGGFDDIAKTAPKLGVSTDALQEMDYWAGQNGISSGDMEKAVGRLNQRIGEAKGGNEKYSNAMTTLGVNMSALTDGTLSTEDAMAQSIKGLSEMTNEQDKAAMASELFGTKLGRELMPALQDGSLSLEDAKKKAEELGIVIDGDTLEAAEEFADTWDDLTRTMGVFGQKILADLMPVFKTMMDWVIENMPMIKDKIGGAIEGAWKVIKKVYELIKPGLVWLSDVGIPAIVSAFEFASEKVGQFMGFVQGFGERFPELQEKISGVLENLKDIFSGAVEIITVVWGRLQPAFEVAWDVIKSLFKTGAVFIGETFTSITEIFSGVIDFVAGVFTGNWTRAWEGVVNIFGGIFSGLAALIKAPLNAVIGLVNGAIGGLNKIKLPDWVPGIGGKGINIPMIPKLAKGTQNWGGGIAQIHERGGEIIDLPKRSRVYPHDKSVSMAREQGRKESSNGGIMITGNTFNVRKESDIDSIANALAKKMRKVSRNMA